MIEEEIALLGKCRRNAGTKPAGDILLAIILRTGNVRKVYPKLGPTPWVSVPPRWVQNQLHIPAGTYQDAIKHLRGEAELIEWKHRGGRATALMRLTVETEAWARAEGILCEPTKADGIQLRSNEILVASPEGVAGNG